MVDTTQTTQDPLRSNLTSPSDYAKEAVKISADVNGVFVVREVLDHMVKVGFSPTSASGAIFRWSDPTDTTGHRAYRQVSPRSGAADPMERPMVFLSGARGPVRMHRVPAGAETTASEKPPAIPANLAMMFGNGEKRNRPRGRVGPRGARAERMERSRQVNSTFTGIPVTNKEGPFYISAGGRRDGQQYVLCEQELLKIVDKYPLGDGWFRTPEVVFDLAEMGFSSNTSYRVIDRVCERTLGRAKVVRTLDQWNQAKETWKALQRQREMQRVLRTDREEAIADARSVLAAELPGVAEAKSAVEPRAEESVVIMAQKAMTGAMHTPATYRLLQRLGKALYLYGREMLGETGDE